MTLMNERLEINESKTCSNISMETGIHTDKIPYYGMIFDMLNKEVELKLGSDYNPRFKTKAIFPKFSKFSERQ